MSKANLLIIGCGEKCALFIASCPMGPSKENEQIMLERLELPEGFKRMFFREGCGKVSQGV